MKRNIIEKPPAAAAVWSARLAVFGLLVAALAALLGRTRTIEPPVALVLLGAAGLFASTALLLAGTAAATIWRDGRAGTGMAVRGAILALLQLAFPLYLAFQSVRLPLLNDVATDTAAPPEFSRSARATALRGGRTPAVAAASVREAQRAAYPAIQPLVVELEAEEAYQLALKTAAQMGWRISESSPPGGRIGLGHIDAVDRTLIMGFPDDIAIRIRPLAGETRIDLRSVSRYGNHDFGVNARRIAAFAAQFQLLLESK